MTHYIGLIPAAGTGSRMGVDLPKQYLDIAGHPMIYYAVRSMVASPLIDKVYVVLAADDSGWQGYGWGEFGDKLQVLRCGGATRAESVTNGLAAMAADAQDWVLVHDAARPCLTVALIAKLITAVNETEIGGLLAIPVADTLKRASDSHVAHTEPRDGLWQAQTPQMFRHGVLQQALNAGGVPTDEASAVEALGHHPLLVAADSSNFKVTYPNDLRMAQLILAQAILEQAND
ncbi:MAG: 2-C-methyl-D-erythritol 4-phosphate cytidylyltransferase [Sulfuriferula sp.]|nr:2-C-methyl-D-erythritol 4-phosphate cytidylyltransferase [Sulfuriferula sp.]